MYEHFEINLDDVSFDWADAKEQLNFQKHGIHFKTAAKAFLDPDKLIHEDAEHLQEQRYNVLGRFGATLFIVCAFKERNVIRIISARLATKPE